MNYSDFFLLGRYRRSLLLSIQTVHINLETDCNLCQNSVTIQRVKSIVMTLSVWLIKYIYKTFHWRTSSIDWNKRRIQKSRKTEYDSSNRFYIYYWLWHQIFDNVRGRPFVLNTLRIEGRRRRKFYWKSNGNPYIWTLKPYF